MYKMFYGVPVIPIGTKWTLDKNYLNLANELGVLRNEEAIKNGAENKLNTSLSNSGNITVNIRGLSGEIAFNLMHDISIKESLNPCLKTIETDTFSKLQNGLTVNTDTRLPRKGDLDLLVRVNKKYSKVNLYALMIDTSPIFEFRGFFPLENMIRRNKRHYLSTGECYYANQDELMNIEDCIYYMIDN